MLKILYWLIPLGIILMSLGFAAAFLPKKKSSFIYRRKACIMTDAERECFAALVTEMGADYHFFPQIHLDAIITPQEVGKKKFYAFRHINQKSVDFVACSKTDLRPLFAIELDDKSHGQIKRVERDREVERILLEACIPLIRIQNRGRFDPKQLAGEIQQSIQMFATPKA